MNINDVLILHIAQLLQFCHQPVGVSTQLTIIVWLAGGMQPVTLIYIKSHSCPKHKTYFIFEEKYVNFNIFYFQLECLEQLWVKQ